MSKKSKRSYDQEVRAMRILGLDRTPLSGSHSKITFGDGIQKDGTAHPRILADNKDRQRHAVWSLMDDVAAKAKAEGGKIPVLTLTQPNKGVLIVLRARDWDIIEIIDFCDGVFPKGFQFRYKGE